MTTLHVQHVRMRATIQDLGRPGFAHLGVPPAGAVDRVALRAANSQVGNDAGAAAIEVVLGGLVVEATAPTRIAVVGGAWSLDGADMAGTTSRDVGDGSRVAVGATHGAYAYLAVAGGIDVPAVLGSRSHDSLSGLGPAPLRPGDVLPVGTPSTAPASLPHPSTDGPLRIVFGPRDEWFTDEARHTLLTAEWTVSARADRIGLRLAGPRLDRARTDDLDSEGVVAGSVQVPPDGQPILFLANHPTTGGYPVIAVVVTSDVDHAAQSRPGTVLRFAAAANGGC